MEVHGGIAERGVDGGVGDLAVDQAQMVGVLVAAADGVFAAERAGEAIEHVVGAEGVAAASAKDRGHRDLIGFAVAVQVASGLEGAQHFEQLVGRGGHFHANRVEPVLIDEQRAGGQNQTEHLLDVGEAVGVAVRRGNFLLIVRVVFQNLGQGGHVGLDQTLGGHEHVLAQRVDHDGGGLAVAEVEEGVGQLLTGGQHQVDLFLSAVARNGLPLKAHASVFFPALDHGQFLDRNGAAGVVDDEHRQLAVLGFEGVRIGDNGGALASVEHDEAGVDGFLGLRAHGPLSVFRDSGNRHCEDAQHEHCDDDQGDEFLH